MELIKFTQCASSLNFDPLEDLKPKLTPTAYLGELLNGFKHDPLREVLNYQKADCDFIDLLKSLYENLSYIEILKLYFCLEGNIQLKEHITAETYFSAFGFKIDENLKLTNSLVLKLPKTFLIWCSQKKWGPQDFAPLRSFTNGISQLAPYLEKFNNSLSKNDGALAFELLVELIMLDTDLNYLFKLDPSQWLLNLKKERYPLTSTQTNKNEALLKKIAWPLHSQAKWIRKGDKSGVELKLFFSHPQELEHSLIRLEQLKNQLQKDKIGQDLWSID